MPEILTESFCERCGTRYTFEASASRSSRLSGLKVVGRGLQNFVLSDDTSMSEAMAAARSEMDRDLTAQQLDAFHKTFNFCMSCRQYTCPNCWNEADGMCLTCAPNLSQEVLAAPFPDPGSRLPMAPVASTNGSTEEHPATEVVVAWPVEDVRGTTADDAASEEIDVEGRLASLVPTGGRATDEPTGRPADAVPETAPGATDEHAAAAAAQTVEFLARFRPGESLDDAIAAFERATVAEPVAAEPVAAEPVAAEPVAAEPVAAEPEPVAAEPEPEPVAARDIVEQPTWRIVAPDATPDVPPLEAPPTTPRPEPSWPARPEWPDRQPGAGLPALGRPPVPSGGIEALWAESSQGVLAQSPASGPGQLGTVTVRPCVSCGLSLSATARFCRRCGSRQDG